MLSTIYKSHAYSYVVKNLKRTRIQLCRQKLTHHKTHSDVIENTHHKTHNDDSKNSHITKHSDVVKNSHTTKHSYIVKTHTLHNTQ